MWFEAKHIHVRVVHIASLVPHAHAGWQPVGERPPFILLPSLEVLDLSTPLDLRTFPMIPRFMPPTLRTLRLHVDRIAMSYYGHQALPEQRLLEAIGNMPHLSSISITFAKCVTMIPKWVSDLPLAHSLPETIEHLELGGRHLPCPELTSFATTLPRLKTWKLWKTRTRLESGWSSSAESAEMDAALRLYAADTMEELDLEVGSTEVPFNMVSISRFQRLTKLVLLVRGRRTPVGLESLEGLTSVRHVEITFHGLDIEFGGQQLHRWTTEWKDLEVLSLRDSQPAWRPTSPLPALKLTDLGCLAHDCPNVCFISIKLDLLSPPKITESHPTGTLSPKTVLDLTGSVLRGEQRAIRVLEYLQRWAPLLKHFRGGDRSPVWTPFETFYKCSNPTTEWDTVLDQPLVWDPRSRYTEK